jgi:thiosulfate/3-mercaptopyruvate sulfurtransferase
MIYTTLISTQTLAANIHNPNWAIFDCRFSLNDPDAGRRAYYQAHLPRAHYLHLDEDLSGAIIPGKTGRHPLPDPKLFVQNFTRWGIDNTTQVIAYDDNNGSIAARLWWLLTWLGHEAVTVLNGGWDKWLREGLPTQTGEPTISLNTYDFRYQVRHELVVNTAEIEKLPQTSNTLLVDSRTPERFRGDVEPIDPVAGHIPGAVNFPYTENFDSSSCFLSPEILQERFLDLGISHTNQAIFYCGSGVTASHNLLALKHAGLGEARLYAGSWSEWITNPQHPISVGDEKQSLNENK